ncbi:MAG: hypothetical protein RL346_1233 [Verrucomicrobiota bacterium]
MVQPSLSSMGKPQRFFHRDSERTCSDSEDLVIRHVSTGSEEGRPSCMNPHFMRALGRPLRAAQQAHERHVTMRRAEDEREVRAWNEQVLVARTNGGGRAPAIRAGPCNGASFQDSSGSLLAGRVGPTIGRPHEG